MKETDLQTPKPVKEERQEVLQVPEQRFPSNPLEDHGGADALQTEEDSTLEQVDVP